MKNKNLIFFCSPGAGMLDQLLPVIKKISKNNKIDLFFYDESIIRDIKKNNFLAKEVENITNKFIYIDTFTNNIKIINNLKKYRIRKINLILNKLTEILIFILKKEINFYNLLKNIILNFSNFKQIKELVKNYDFIICDATELEKLKFSKIKEIFLKKKILSFHHGSDFQYFKKNWIIPKNNYRKNINHFLLSNTIQEKNYYKYKLKINEKKLHKVGLAKNSKSWINYVIKNNSLETFVKSNKGKYVFLISRHTEKNYLPTYQKLEYLKIIKKNIIDNLNLKLVIKMHPKEKYENYFNIVFGKKNKNKTWFISNNHPYILGKNSIFTITFFSGLAVDMSVIGKNNIELINLAPHYENNKDKIFYKNKNYYFKIRYLQLTNGASNEKEFNNLVDKILNKKFFFKSDYSKYYYNPNKSLSKISKIISKI